MGIQASTIFIPLFLMVIPGIMIATNNGDMGDSQVNTICEREDFKNFPTEEFGDCVEFGKEVQSTMNGYLLVVIVIAIPITIMLELNVRWSTPVSKPIYPIMNVSEEHGEIRDE
jgi:hypothetical protein